MNANRRAKLAAGATVVGLAAIGGAALGTNHGLTGPVASVGSGGGHAPIVTGASGSTAATSAGATVEAGHRPIVTRASTAGTAGATFDD
jgi:hypothetical protein